jgi:hypothetical protein
VDIGKKMYEGNNWRKKEEYNNEERDDEDEDDEGLVRNLLGIRENTNDENDERTSMLSAPGNKGAISITQLFEPKFLSVFNLYRQEMCSSPGGVSIDLSQHLVSLCLDHLIQFSCWARESTGRCAWIQKTLDDNADCRPEVRNGLCMLFVYALSAAKATEQKGRTDMFLVLQDSATGLGIVNKTSLKIYNDPFNYFAFLKACMSGLIDAGKLPENERLNQVM